MKLYLRTTSREASLTSHSGPDGAQSPSIRSMPIHDIIKQTKCVLALVSNDLVQDPDLLIIGVTRKINASLNLNILFCKN